MSNADLIDMQPAADFSREGKGGKSVAIFGWSRTEPNTPRWEEAERIGRLSAENGFSIVTGGYCGSMEAASKGAREAIGTTEASKSITVNGVLVPSQFPNRMLAGNQYLMNSVKSQNLCHRLHLLIANSRYFILLPGTLGSLTELLVIWSLALLNPATAAKPLILCLRNPWERMVKNIEADLDLEPHEVPLLTFVDTVDEAMEIIQKDAALVKVSDVPVEENK